MHWQSDYLETAAGSRFMDGTRIFFKASGIVSETLKPLLILNEDKEISVGHRIF